MQCEQLDPPVEAHHSVFSSPTSFDDRRVGAAAVYCSDGRYGEQMDEFLHAGLGLPRYDRVAVPGGAGCLAGHTCAYHEKNALIRQLDFLIRGHQLRRVVLIAHHGCGFYRDLWTGLRTVESLQQSDLHKAAELIRESHPQVDVEAFFARPRNGRVTFERWAIGNPSNH